MTTDDLPQARRMRRPTWRDPRLGVGIVLVAGSVALGAWAVRDAAATVEVYAAGDALTPGDAVTVEELTVREVRLGDDEDLYHLAADPLPEDAVAIRTIGAGELVPRTAVGGSEAVSVQPIVVSLGLAVPTDLGPGTVVDLWLAPAQATTGAASTESTREPELLAPTLVVAEVMEDDSVLAGTQGTSVELLVPRDEVSAVLAALSSEGQLVAVPTIDAGGADVPEPDET
ncbi:flagellar protein FlgA [Georgenia halophila]|uniref:Flagellar protein FlgA n=2 Tax=Georgenia halophila TaxID=620889 RepID=A0ABP8KVB0_9MICO